MKKSNKKKGLDSIAPQTNKEYTVYCSPHFIDMGDRMPSLGDNVQESLSKGYKNWEKQAEMANRFKKARKFLRGECLNFDDINMYGTHVNGEKRKSRESVKEGLKHQSTVNAVSDALDGRYPLERNIRAVTFCHDDFMRIVELISKVTDSQLREDIVMSIIEAKSNAHDLLGK